MSIPLAQYPYKRLKRVENQNGIDKVCKKMILISCQQDGLCTKLMHALHSRDQEIISGTRSISKIPIEQGQQVDII